MTQEQRDQMKVAVCEYMLKVNRQFVAESGYPFIAPTAIDWLGDGIVSAIDQIEETEYGDHGQ